MLKEWILAHMFILALSVIYFISDVNDKPTVARTQYFNDAKTCLSFYILTSLQKTHFTVVTFYYRYRHVLTLTSLKSEQHTLLYLRVGEINSLIGSYASLPRPEKNMITRSSMKHLCDELKVREER